MSETKFKKQETLNALPREWEQDLLPKIREWVDKSKTKIVILDDDPTGTQTIHGLPVLTIWDVDSLKKELISSYNAFFILTNSRGLTQFEAINLAGEISLNLKLASTSTGVNLSVISRSDSTLRGHFPHEVDAVADVLENNNLPYLICPFFLEGGRYTINDIHYVEEGTSLVPASQTAFARDATFGFNNSNLCRWVEEKTAGKILAEQVVSISINDIRKEGPKKITQILLNVPDNGACIVNAASYKDIEVIAAGLLDARSKGRHFLYRTAASFVRVRVGIIPKQKFLTKKDLVFDHNSGRSSGGLFIVGSYVPKTTAQVNALLNETDISPIKINVDNLLDPLCCEKEMEMAQAKANLSLEQGKDTLIYTSRDLVLGNDPDASLKIGQAVSSGLINIVKGLNHQPRYLVAKGGITSSDVATMGLNIKRALVMGQALPGVPVWKTGMESKYPGMSYIIFPGNVGDDTALVQIQQKLI